MSNSFSSKSICVQSRYIDGGRLIDNDFCDKFSSDGPQGHADHGVAGGDREILVPPGATKDRQAVRGAGTSPLPGFEHLQFVDVDVW